MATAKKTNTVVNKSAQKSKASNKKNAPIEVKGLSLGEENAAIEEIIETVAEQRAEEIIEAQPAIQELTVIEDNTPEAVVDNAGNLQLQIPVIEISDELGVLTSKRYVKGGLEFKSPEELLRAAIDLLATTGGKITVEATHAVENANTDGSVNTAFGRLNLVCRYHIDAELFYEIGVLVALDLKTPKVKVYSGPKVRACMNLCIFNAADIVTFDIQNGVNIEAITQYIENLVAKMESCIELIGRLKEIKISEEQLSPIIGNMLVRTTAEKRESGTTAVLRAVDLLTDPKSKYFYKQEGFNSWLLYNSFTEYFSEKINFFDIPEKTKDIFMMMRPLVGA